MLTQDIDPGLITYAGLVEDLVSEVSKNDTGVAIQELPFTSELSMAINAVRFYMSNRNLVNTAPSNEPKAEFGDVRVDGLRKFLPNKSRLLKAVGPVSDVTTLAVQNVLGSTTRPDSIAYNRHEPGAVGKRHRDSAIKIAVALMNGGALVEYADDLVKWEELGPWSAKIKNQGLLVVRGGRLNTVNGPRAPFHQISELSGSHGRESVPFVYF